MAVTEQEIKHIAKEAAECAVKATFTAMGINMSTPEGLLESQKDFAWMRGRRVLEGKIWTRVILSVVTLIIGITATAWAVLFWRDKL